MSKLKLEYGEFLHSPATELVRYQLPSGYYVVIESGDEYDRAVYYSKEGKAVATEYGILFPASYIEMLEQKGGEVVKQIMEESAKAKIHAVK